MLDERGIAFVVSLVMMLVLVVLGYGLLVATDGSTRAETGLKAQTSAFEVADAGIEFARETLRACIAGTGSSPCNSPQTLDTMLNRARNGSTLRDSTSLSVGFPSTTATANGTNNTPLVASNTTLLSPSAFQVFLTNDPGDGVTVATDGTGVGAHRVTLTSFASGPNSIGFAVLQAVVEVPLFDLNNVFQATLILPGPDVNLPTNQPWATSNNFGIANNSCVATVAVTSNPARNTIWSVIPTNRKDTGHYSDNCSPADSTSLGVYDFLQGTNPYPGGAPNPAPPPGMPLASQNLITISYYQNQLLPMLYAVANFRSPSDAGFTLGNPNTNPPVPQIVYITGDYAMNTDGAGILVVTGNLTISGNPTYKGLILAIGAGNVTFNGSGNGNMTGSIIVVNTTPWSTDTRYVSSPTINLNGGGNSGWGFGGNSVGNIPFTGIASPRRISFAQLR